MAGESETTRAAWQELLAPPPPQPPRPPVPPHFSWPPAPGPDSAGTRAPIAERAEDAGLLDGAREVLVALTERYALVGAVSGRRAADVRGLIGLDSLAYAGTPGPGLLRPGGGEPSPDPSLAGRERDAAEFLATVEAERLGGSELRVE